MIIFINIVHAAILWTLEFFLYPELLIYPYLRTLGFLPYKDILDQHFPGLMFFPTNFYSLGFTDPASFKLLLILIVVVQSMLVYKIAVRLGGKLVAIAASVAYLIWQPFFEGNQLWLDIFLPLFTLPAFWFFMKEKWFITGLFLGMGIIFKQTQVPMVAFVGLCILFKYKNLNSLIRFSLGALLPSCVMLVHLASIGVWSDFWYWTVLFNLSDFASQGSLAPRIEDLVKLSLPVGLVLLAVWRLRSTRFISLWMISTIVGGIARFGLLHFQPAIPYLSLIIGLLFHDLWLHRKKAMMIGILLFMFVWTGYFYSRQNNFFETKFFDSTTDQIVADIRSRTNEGDKVFLLGVHPHIYVLSRTVPPGKTFIFQFPWFFKIAGNRIAQTLINDPPKVVIFEDDSNIDGQYMRDYGKFLLDIVRQNYDLVDKRGTIEVYEYRN